MSKKSNDKRSKREPSMRTSTTCLCPLCRRQHRKLLHWTGRGQPRVYCPDCQQGNNWELRSPEVLYNVNDRAISSHRAEEN